MGLGIEVHLQFGMDYFCEEGGLPGYKSWIAKRRVYWDDIIGVRWCIEEKLGGGAEGRRQGGLGM